MRILTLLTALLMPSLAMADIYIDDDVPHHGPLAHSPSAPFSAGVALGLPGAIGGYASFWPSDEFSLDLRVTTTAADFGITPHVHLSGPHCLLLNGTLGYAINGVLEGGPVLGLALGYGYQSAWDVRILAGLAGYGTSGNWGPHLGLMLGHFL